MSEVDCPICSTPEHRVIHAGPCEWYHPAERRYTLEEARRELAKQECQLHGHDFEIVVQAGHADPNSIVCGRCGKTWNVDLGFVWATDQPESNSRRYVHPGCCGWTVPLDDVPLPEETECDECAEVLPVVAA